jgi:D-sedoheptulose 7-phosphate isomerase
MGLMAERDIGGTDFLYPFIDGNEHDSARLLADLGQSAVAKARASAELRASTLERTVDEVRAIGGAVATAFRHGGTLFTFGNGGSATDAAGLATLFARPPWGRPLPARCLVDDMAVLTALGNDVGFDLVFSRQLIAHAVPGDIAVGISTSGGSRNVLLAFTHARARDLLTVGLAGYDGGEMAMSSDVRHCLVVRSDSVHRVQETQAALGVAVWRAVQTCLADDGSAVRDG